MRFCADGSLCQLRAFRFIKVSLGAPSGTDVEALKAENAALLSKVQELEEKLSKATTPDE